MMNRLHFFILVTTIHWVFNLVVGMCTIHMMLIDEFNNKRPMSIIRAGTRVKIQCKKGGYADDAATLHKVHANPVQVAALYNNEREGKHWILHLYPNAVWGCNCSDGNFSSVKVAANRGQCSDRCGESQTTDGCSTREQCITELPKGSNISKEICNTPEYVRTQHEGCDLNGFDIDDKVENTKCYLESTKTLTTISLCQAYKNDPDEMIGISTKEADNCIIREKGKIYQIIPNLFDREGGLPKRLSMGRTYGIKKSGSILKFENCQLFASLDFKEIQCAIFYGDEGNNPLKSVLIDDTNCTFGYKIDFPDSFKETEGKVECWQLNFLFYFYTRIVGDPIDFAHGICPDDWQSLTEADEAKIIDTVKCEWGNGQSSNITRKRAIPGVKGPLYECSIHNTVPICDLFVSKRDDTVEQGYKSGTIQSICKNDPLEPHSGLTANQIAIILGIIALLLLVFLLYLIVKYIKAPKNISQGSLPNNEGMSPSVVPMNEQMSPSVVPMNEQVSPSVFPKKGQDRTFRNPDEPESGNEQFYTVAEPDSDDAEE